MRQCTAILLAAILAFSLTACGEPAYDPEKDKTDASQQNVQQEEKTDAQQLIHGIYQELKQAGTQTETMGKDLCAAWKAGLDDETALLKNGIKLLDQKVSLNAKELTEGAAHRMAELDGSQWERLSAEKQAAYRKDVQKGFVQAKKEERLFGFCIETVLRAYSANGTAEKVDVCLRELRNELRNMGSEHSDNPYGEDLRSFYKTVGDYYAWCVTPHGSYQEAAETLNGYQTQIETITGELDEALAD